MKTIIPNVIAMSERELLAVIGAECHGTLLLIDHSYLNYGEHRTYNKVQTVYNEAGLVIILEKLREFKLEKSAYCLEVELSQRRQTPSRLRLLKPCEKSSAAWYRTGAMA